MCLNELHALYEHTTRTTTRVIYLTTIRLNHLGYEVDNGLRRIVLTFTLTFGNGKLTEEVFIDTPDEIILWVFQCVNLVNFIKQCSKFCAIERQTSIVVTWQGTLQRRVALLHFRQSLVYLNGNIILLGILNQKIPTTFRLQIKDVLGIIEHGIICKSLFTFSYQFIAPLRKAVVRIFQEDKTQHHMLILRWFNRATKFIG